MNYFVSRVLQAGLTILVLLTLTFFAARTTGDPALSLLPTTATDEQRVELRHELHLDQPVWQQYVAYVRDLAVGDLGHSYYWDASVTELLGQRAPVTGILSLLGGALTLALGLPLGIVAARRRGKAADNAVLAVALLGQSVPIFVTALAGILLFSVKLRWLPVAGTGTPAGYVLPSATLGLFGVASMIRVTRVSMLNALASEYIVTARAKGLRLGAIIWRHALRNALIPVVTIFSLILATLLTGTVVTELMFAMPGLGRLAVDAIVVRDFPVVQGVVLVTTGVFVLMNLAVDLLYGVIDPRTRRAGR